MRLIDAGRVDSALSAWAAGQAFGLEERQQVRSSIPVFEEACGSVSGHELLRVVAIASRVMRVYFIVRCAVRPLYLMLAVYESPRGWIITTLNWSSDPDRVLPESFFGQQRP